MKKHFTTLFGILFTVILLASCTEISDPMEEITDLVENEIVLNTDDGDDDKGGPKGGE
ncbi:MAG: hypothetical protein R8G66_06435 [Cytophagales bacterium]|nr:hypothetical protein [Cytophagales bacterium]